MRSHGPHVLPSLVRSQTAVCFDLPVDAHARISFLDAADRVIAALLDERLPAGPHRTVWNLSRAGRRAIPSGTYFVRLEVAGLTSTGKAVVLQ